jgi:hypothetical protein
MNHIELMPVVSQVVEGVGLMKLEGIMLLRSVVHAYHLEPGTVVAHRRPSRTTKQIEQFHNAPTFASRPPGTASRGRSVASLLPSLRWAGKIIASLHIHKKLHLLRTPIRIPFARPATDP